MRAGVTRSRVADTRTRTRSPAGNAPDNSDLRERIVAALEDILELRRRRPLDLRAPEREIAGDILGLLHGKETFDRRAQLGIVGALTAIGGRQQHRQRKDEAQRRRRRHRSSEKRTVIVIRTGTGYSIELGRRIPPLAHGADGSLLEQRLRTEHTDALDLAGRVENGLHRDNTLHARQPGDLGIHGRHVHKLPRFANHAADAHDLRNRHRRRRRRHRRWPGRAEIGHERVRTVDAGTVGDAARLPARGRTRRLRERSCQAQLWVRPTSLRGTLVGGLGGGGGVGATVGMKCSSGEATTGNSTPVAHGLNSRAMTIAPWPAIERGNTDQWRCLRPAASPVRSTSRKNS